MKPQLAGLPVQSCLPDQEALRQADKLRKQNQAFALVSLPPARWATPGWILLTGLVSTQTPQTAADIHPYSAGCIEVWLFGFEWLAANHLQQNGARLPQRERAAGKAQGFSFTEAQLFPGKVGTEATPYRSTPPVSGDVPADYKQHIRQIQAWLRAGELYQFNLTRRFQAAGDAASLWACWQAGCQRFLPPFASFVHIPEHATVASLSPEEWISCDGERLCTSPIKGTGSVQSGVLETAKNRAEHTMIVDLERNDLMRVCQAGSIATDPFCAPVAFGGISHLVSLVAGALQPDTHFHEIVTALGPGGSVTGAPKIAMLQKVYQVEKSPRGWYCGGIGIRTGEKAFSFNLPIRTAWLEGQEIIYHSGGGIVADSTAEGEWQELQEKLYWISACI